MPVDDYTPQQIELLLQPALLAPLPEQAVRKLTRYLQLLFRWNQRMNLTAVRDPRVFAALHLGECVRLAQSLPGAIHKVMDFGSGAGLPGIPVLIARPEIDVTLAESQGKKAAFLREVLRELDLAGGSVYSGRVEAMRPESLFDCVALRAVDRMDRAVFEAEKRIVPGGLCAVLTSVKEAPGVVAAASGLRWLEPDPIPQSEQRVILMGRKPGLDSL